MATLELTLCRPLPMNEINVAGPISYASVMLSVNRALWGEVSERVYAVQVSFQIGQIDLYTTFLEEPTESDINSAHVAGVSVAADFPKYKVFDHCEQIYDYQNLPKSKGRHLVFLRKIQGS